MEPRYARVAKARMLQTCRKPTPVGSHAGRRASSNVRAVDRNQSERPRQHTQHKARRMGERNYRRRCLRNHCRNCRHRNALPLINRN